MTLAPHSSQNFCALESVLSQNDQEELAVEWSLDGCGLISEELVPSLIGHSVRLDRFEIVEVR